MNNGMKRGIKLLEETLGAGDLILKGDALDFDVQLLKKIKSAGLGSFHSEVPVHSDTAA